ncbi:Bis(5'-nucleosyl)-tetraphosphatase, symmetrical [Zhongshania aliphaticivorans]|uniref:bis(5'-nucleosyl)-tetraphosphatase (symmetrical) n=1 Tax=Zhongshania aliphaticivorans TaxID=1470434 RepID=A0A5S9NX19_9GAMM|nr:symmetrical bis(5'-nucleosyl)-tetraphosphatase [Zhongshania aliphaticivorans]CAA0095162.1 Bis(5'-nucleosyl)-tetraphosphatase, symmetrical [Zhongshania aliphaticivorans]CAA0112946.1 Bis(5'-nucleosyl)-tetraphosphatase, symmetrical [Zhongshania aliphaticivorans]
MSNYAVGDLQGCLKPLQRLLKQVNFDANVDQLWLVGDLVNRGPDSLDTLRFLYSMKDSLRITLGNHDLHTIALARKATTRGRHPTLEALLNAHDCDELTQWLLQQPLVRKSDDGRYLMSHAGIPHIWSSHQALSLSKEVESTLQSVKVDDFFHNMYGDSPLCWRDDLCGNERLRTITNYLTRMRACDAHGELELSFKGSPADIPAPYRPWFEWQPLNQRQETLIFGHWAALECNTGRNDIIALDSGCVWGRHMTMLNMDTQQLYRCECKP